MIYQLRSVRSNRAGFECLGQLAKATRHLYADKLELDMSRVSSFDANMAAPLGVVLARTTDNFNSVKIVSVPADVEQILRRNQFLTHFRYEPIDDVQNTTIPYCRFRLSDMGALEEYVHRLFAREAFPGLSDMARRMFKKNLFEVYHNAVTHSESLIGTFVCGQTLSRDRLDFTIADGGIGIRDAVRRYFKILWTDENRELVNRISSVAALKWAVRKSHTTKRGNHPGGLGLEFIRQFATKNQGKIRIVSRFAFHEYDGGNEVFLRMTSDFPGTAVTVEVNTADTNIYLLRKEVSSSEEP